MLRARHFFAVPFFVVPFCAGALSALCPAAGAQAQPLLAEPIRPLPLPGAVNKPRAALGRALFNDLRLSNDNLQSCASCHQLAKGGADTRPLSAGAGGLPTRFNTPTVYNAMLNFRQSWTGRYSGMNNASPVDFSVRPYEGVSDIPALLAVHAACAEKNGIDPHSVCYRLPNLSAERYARAHTR